MKFRGGFSSIAGWAGFTACYGVANAGAFVAFMPLLILLLPLKAAAIDPANKFLLLSIVLLCGAVTASIANIAAGWVSDRIFSRRHSRIGQIQYSLLAVVSSYYLFWRADSWLGLIIAILAFQCSFNFLFSPLSALLADHVPDHQKGRTAAILNLGTPIGSLSVAFLTLSLFTSEASRLLAIALILSSSILILVAFIRRGPPLQQIAPQSSAAPLGSTSLPKDLVWAWLARFSVQFSGAVIIGYIFYYLQDIIGYATLFAPQKVDQGVGLLNLAATPIAVAAGLLAGSYSDHIGRRRPFLIAAAALIASAIMAMALWPIWPVAFLAYISFVTGSTCYLTIDAALVTQILSGSPVRAKIMGYMNLTNTIPAILTPTVAILLSGAGLEKELLIGLLTTAAIFALFGSLAASRISAAL